MVICEPDNSDGYWFWDSNMNIWWWTKPTIYPYFYGSNGTWNYWHFNVSQVYFDYQKNTGNPLGTVYMSHFPNFLFLIPCGWFDTH